MWINDLGEDKIAESFFVTIYGLIVFHFHVHWICRGYIFKDWKNPLIDKGQECDYLAFAPHGSCSAQ